MNRETSRRSSIPVANQSFTRQQTPKQVEVPQGDNLQSENDPNISSEMIKSQRTAMGCAKTRAATAQSQEIESLKEEIKNQNRAISEMRQMFTEFIKATQPTNVKVTEPNQANQDPNPIQQQSSESTGQILAIEGQPTTSSGQVVELKHINIMLPPKFDGDSSKAISWLMDYKEIMAINKWSESDSLNYVRQSLTNAAKAWYRSIWFESVPSSWSNFDKEFKIAFLRGNSSDSLRAQLRRLKQTKDMDPMTYYYKTMELCMMIDRKMSEEDKIQQVIDNMLPDIKAAVGMKEPQTVIELQRAIKLYVAYHPRETPNNQPNKVRRPGEDNKPQGQNKQRPEHPKEDHWCVNCGKKGHYPRECPVPYNQEAVDKRRAEWRINPPFKNRISTSNNKGRANAVVKEDQDDLGRSGESDDESYEEINYDQPQVGSVRHHVDTIHRSGVINSVCTSRRPSSITCRVNGKTVNAILDTGATLSVVPFELVKATQTPLYKWKGNSLSLANGQTQAPLGWCEASVEYEDRTFTVHAVVLRQAPDILLGDDYINKSGVVISYHDNVITYNDKYMKLAARYLDRVKPKDHRDIDTQTDGFMPVDSANHQVQHEHVDDKHYYVEYIEERPKICSLTTLVAEDREQRSERLVKSRTSLLIPPKSKARIDAKTTGPASLAPLFIEPVAHTMLFAVPGISRRSRHVIDVINVSDQPLQVNKNDIIARAISLEEVHEEPQQKADLTDKQEKQLNSLLAEYDELFVTKNENIGIVPFIKHVIDTGDTYPLRSKPYRVSFTEQKVIRDLVDEMLNAGVIRPSRSHWASPVVLVKKKGTTDLRFCVDYRKLNRVTKVDPYPIPNMEAVLETLSGNHWFSKLDIKSMYWQVLMDEESRQKTAFVVHCGHYEFNVMPFGLVAAPMTAMRVMNEVVKGLESHSFVFYDDILAYSSTFDEHMKVLRSLFVKLRKANITLNKNKCELLMKSVTYLGHVVTPTGILPDPDKVKSITAFPTPTNITQARSFIGMCNFFRRYIRGFSGIAKPIHDTIKVKQEFVWTEEAQQAMNELKKKLTSSPLLVHYDQAGHPVIRCDASGYGLGAVLLQKSDDPSKDGVVAYTSRTLTPSERNYATTHKECLAMVHAIKQWRYYLYGKHFQVITDHHALCWLMKTKDHTGQLARWSLILQEFQFTIHYSSGKLHDDADCLSRNPLPANETAEEEHEIPTWPVSAIRRHKRVEKLIADHELTVPTYDVAREQRADVNLKRIIETLDNPDAPRKEKRKHKYYLLKDNQLYRRSKRHKNVYLLVIPESMITYVMEQAHDAPSSGHFGIKRTTETLRSRFYWQTLDRDVKQYVKTCNKCQMKKADNRPKEGLMVPMPIPSHPFEIIGIDLLGPLPMSTSKKNHILVITDYLTKYVIASPMRKTTTARITDHLKRLVFFQQGIPKTIITDNGANLTSYEMRKLLDLLKIKHKTTCPYRPQTNGQTERYNRVIGSQLAIFASEKPQDWDKYLDALVFAYNTSVHASHLQTPFYLVYTREARKLLDLVADQPIQQISQDDDLTDEQILIEARRFARDLIKKSQIKAKARYDSSRVVSKYKVGDLVLKKKQLNQMKESRKFSFPWYGPFRVIKRLNNVNIQISLVEYPEEEHIVHVSQVKPYHARHDEDLAEGETDAEQESSEPDDTAQDESDAEQQDEFEPNEATQESVDQQRRPTRLDELDDEWLSQFYTNLRIPRELIGVPFPDRK